MASTIKVVKIQGVGTAVVNLTTGTETTPASTKVWNIPRLYIANVHATLTPTITVTHVTSAVSTNITIYKMGLKGSKDGTLILENIALRNGDTVQILSDTAASVDSFGSVMEEDA